MPELDIEAVKAALRAKRAVGSTPEATIAETERMVELYEQTRLLAMECPALARRPEFQRRMKQIRRLIEFVVLREAV